MLPDRKILKKMPRKLVPVALLAASVFLSLWASAGTALAGIYDADQEVAYKEYWVSHVAPDNQFTGGFQPDATSPWLAAAGCLDYYNFGWFIEPWPSVDVNGQFCEKTLEFDIPDSLNGAIRAEIYLDLWRNHASPQARFTLNGGPLHIPNIGDDWSRNGWVGNIPLNELKTGTNTMILSSAGGGFHIHDIAVRVYYDAAAIGAPAGFLKSVSAGGATIAPPTSGGVLNVNGDQVTLTASVTSADVSFVEFHAYYEGYDEDNDRVFRDWHNRGRNEWHVGGRFAKPTGGTIDHIGTVPATGPGDYSITWNMAHIHNQAGVKFKIRLVTVDTANDYVYIVRDAAGGISGDFKLVRNRAVMSFYDPAFFDRILCHRDSLVNGQLQCSFETEQTVSIYTPVDTTQFNKAYFLGSYWDNPSVKINGNSEFGGSTGYDWWTLAVQERPVGEFVNGANSITYLYNPNTNYFGQFVERPGPMIVLAQTSVSADTTAPQVFSISPFPGQGGLPVDTEIRIILSEFRNHIGHGLDLSTVKLRVNGSEVTPTISGFSNEYTLVYKPPLAFSPGSQVSVDYDACDLAGNCIPAETSAYTFSVQGNNVPFDGVSDDFNVCELDTNTWTWTDPQAGGVGKSTYQLSEGALLINVPGGTAHDVWVDGNAAPRMMQTINNAPNFSLQAKFETLPFAVTQLQGLLIEQDVDTFLRIDFQYRGGGNPGVYLFVAGLDNGAAAIKVLPDAPINASGNTPVYLRVDRSNTTQWRVGYSLDGFDWVDYFFDHSITTNRAGVFAGNALDNPAFSAKVDYFFNAADPVDEEDAEILRFFDLPVSIDPNGTPAPGTITGAPQTPSVSDPECGSPLVLTAVPSTGWRFGGWEVSVDGSTDYSSLDNPLTAIFKVGNSVRATFERDAYIVNLAVDNSGGSPGGSATLVPDKPLYDFGDVVTATVSMPPGWQFIGWSGDLTGTDPSQTFTVTEDMSATATFNREVYALSLDVAGSGQGFVQKVPDKSQFVYGEQLVLAAFPAAGSDFGGWQGDIPPSVDPLSPTLTMTMTGDAVISATFVRSYSLSTSVRGEGSIEIEPEKAQYEVGETVRLTAVPEQGWRFVRWEGSVNGDSLEIDVVMNSSKFVWAIFEEDAVQPRFSSYLPLVRP